MADKKISALTASAVPLAGTEVLPIVQSGATVKVAVSNLTAGRAVSATQLTLTTGNLIVANGNGVDFSATPGTGTSELLDDYEEGTWTPTIFDAATGGNQGTFNFSSGYYTKVGDIVTLHCNIEVINTTGMTAANPFYIGGIPFNAKNTTSVNFYGVTDSRAVTSTTGGIIASWLLDNSSRIRLYTTSSAGSIVPTLVSNVTSGSASIYLSLTYLTA